MYRSVNRKDLLALEQAFKPSTQVKFVLDEADIMDEPGVIYVFFAIKPKTQSIDFVH